MKNPPFNSTKRRNCDPDCSENGNVAVNLCPVSLGHTFRDPDDVPVLLLLQLHVGIKHTKLKLLHEGILHEIYLK